MMIWFVTVLTRQQHHEQQCADPNTTETPPFSHDWTSSTPAKNQTPCYKNKSFHAEIMSHSATGGPYICHIDNILSSHLQN